jgi:hypothetical protein
MFQQVRDGRKTREHAEMNLKTISEIPGTSAPHLKDDHQLQSEVGVVVER